MEIERGQLSSWYEGMGIRTAPVQTAGSGCGFSAWLAASHQIRWDFIFESSERGRLVASVVSWDRQVSLNFKYLCVRSLKCWRISRPFLRISFFCPVHEPTYHGDAKLREYPYLVTSATPVYGIIRTVSHDCQVICHTSVSTGNTGKLFGRTSTSGALHCTAMPPKKQIQLQVR